MAAILEGLQEFGLDCGDQLTMFGFIRSLFNGETKLERYLDNNANQKGLQLPKYNRDCRDIGNFSFDC